MRALYYNAFKPTPETTDLYKGMAEACGCKLIEHSEHGSLTVEAVHRPHIDLFTRDLGWEPALVK